MGAMGDAAPNLAIHYSSDFSFSIRLSGVQVYEAASSDYRFDLACRIRHTKGEFTYTATNIYFAPQVFRDFVQQLDAIRKGKNNHAHFHDYGQMVEFSLNLEERTMRASLRIREFQAGAEDTLLSAGFPVDYDLFVNALFERTSKFIEELEGTEPA